MRRLWYLMWKELLELRQDPRLFGVIFLAPVIQLTFLGYAATTDVKNVPIVVVDQDHTPQSRELITRFDGSPYFTVVGQLNSVAEIERWFESNRAWMGLVIPGDYHERVDGNRQATVQVIADGTDSNSTNVAMGYAANLITAYNEELARERLIAAGHGAQPRAIE